MSVVVVVVVLPVGLVVVASVRVQYFSMRSLTTSKPGKPETGLFSKIKAILKPTSPVSEEIMFFGMKFEHIKTEAS